MSSERYPNESRIEAIRQVVDRSYSVAEVAERLGVTTHNLYDWKKKYGPDAASHQAASEEQAEIKRLKKSLQRITQVRDILKKTPVDSIGQRNRGYPFDRPLAGDLNQTFASLSAAAGKTLPIRHV